MHVERTFAFSDVAGRSNETPHFDGVIASQVWQRKEASKHARAFYDLPALVEADVDELDP